MLLAISVIDMLWPFYIFVLGSLAHAALAEVYTAPATSPTVYATHRQEPRALSTATILFGPAHNYLQVVVSVKFNTDTACF